MNGTFFGCLLVDICTRPHSKKRFVELRPIFKNTTVSRDTVKSDMNQLAVDRKSPSKPTDMLVASYCGKKILLTSDLIKWYVDHGLVVSKIRT